MSYTQDIRRGFFGNNLTVTLHLKSYVRCYFIGKTVNQFKFCMHIKFHHAFALGSLNIFPAVNPPLHFKLFHMKKLLIIILKNIDTVLKRKNINFAHLFNNTIKNIEINNQLKPNRNEIDCIGVFSIERRNCNALCIGNIENLK